VRVSSIIGAFYNANIYLAAGRSLGLDAWLHKHFRNSPFFSEAVSRRATGSDFSNRVFAAG